MSHDSPSPATPDETQPSRSQLTVLAVGILVALAIRLIGFTTQSISMDEAVELGIAAFPVDELITFGNSFPPLYHLLLKAWTGVCTSIFAGRILSLVLSLLSIVAVYRLAFENAGHKVAVVTLALAVISPFHTFYSQDGRAYMLYFLLAVLAFLTATRLAREYSRWNLAAFVLVSVIGGYTHYYFAIVLVAVACGVVASFGIKQIPRFAISAVVIGVLCIPVVFLLKNDLEFQTNLRAARPLNIVSGGYTFFSFASGYSLGPSKTELHTTPPQEAILQALPWMAAVALAYGIPFIAGCLALGRKLSFWLVLLIAPLVLLFVCCQTLGLTYNPRFAIWLWVPFIVICAAGISRLSSKSAVAISVLLIAVSAAAIGNRQFVDRYKNVDVAAVAEFVQEKVIDSGDKLPLVVCSGYMEYPFQAYLDPDEFKIVPTVDVTYKEGSTEAAIKTCEEQAPTGFWFAYARAFHGDPDGQILNTVLGFEAKLVLESAGIKLYRVEPQM